MRTIHFAALCVILFASGAISRSDEENTTTTDNPTPTEKSTMITELTTTSTEAPTTSTDTPTPSTDTSTPSTEVITTTIAPTTTEEPSTTPASTTTKSPKPAPPPTQEGSWNVTEGNVTCIIAKLEVLFKIPINGIDHYIALSPNASSNGNCEVTNTTQILSLREADPEYGLEFTFEKDSDKVYISNISLSYSLPEERGFVRSDKKLYTVSLGNSYLCKSEQDVKLENVTMEIKSIQFQAFRDNNDDKFGSVESCPADDKVSDAVPIAVGCALVALIIIVLIAYLVGRRRSRQKGYQSV